MRRPSMMGALFEKRRRQSNEGGMEADCRCHRRQARAGRTKIATVLYAPFLIEHANVEIRFNSRYELMQVKNSRSGIRVIDHDQKRDDVRDTTSLSRWRDLHQLARTGPRLSAIVAQPVFRESLHRRGFRHARPRHAPQSSTHGNAQSSQGKKVGVISHTDTMSERITTQIRIVGRTATREAATSEIYPQ